MTISVGLFWAFEFSFIWSIFLFFVLVPFVLIAVAFVGIVWNQGPDLSAPVPHHVAFPTIAIKSKTIAIILNLHFVYTVTKSWISFYGVQVELRSEFLVFTFFLKTSWCPLKTVSMFSASGFTFSIKLVFNSCSISNSGKMFGRKATTRMPIVTNRKSDASNSVQR